MDTLHQSKNQLVAANQKIKERDYWLKKLSGDLIISSFSHDNKINVNECINNGRVLESVEYSFTGELFANLMKLSGGVDHTLHVILSAILVLLLNKYKGNRDIIIGTSIFNQSYEVDFVNTILVVRTHLKIDMTFKELLLQMRQTIVEAHEHQNYPIEVLLEKLNLPVTGNHFPLFEVAILLENIQNKKYIEKTKPNIIFSFSKKRGCIQGVIEYNSLLYEKTTLEQIGAYFTHLLHQGLANPNGLLSSMDLLPPEKKKQLLWEFNNTDAHYPKDKTMHNLFEEQVEKTPNNTAIVYEMKHLSYLELNKRSNQLARILKKIGVYHEVVVGIMMEPSIEMVISLLAVLKSGGAYLPILPGFPGKRVLFMLEDANAGAILLSSQQLKRFNFTMLQGLESGRELQVRCSTPRAHIKDFNNLPMPDRSLVNLKNYKNRIGMASVSPCISIQATRGCPYECVFCHKIWSKKHVFRNANNIYSEIEYYYKNGVINFAIIDDCFNLNKENSTQLFKLIIKNKLKVRLFFPNGLRGDILTPGDIDLMVEAGTVGINLSLETASPRLQKLIKKNLHLAKFKQTIDYIASQHPGVILEIAVMHGFPTETEKEALMTLDFIKGVKWLHFPYIHILKIYPNTEMEELALRFGVSPQDIAASKNLAFHELPETLPFPKSFTRKYQSDFLNDYFLSRERLKQVLPAQMKILSTEALVEKYNTYLPAEIHSIEDIINFTGLHDIRLPRDPPMTTEIRDTVFDKEPEMARIKPGAKKILFLDLSQHFSTHHMLYNVSEQPIGLISLLTCLKQAFGDKIDGRIYKSGIDFDSFDQLRMMVKDYEPDLVGIRSLTFYKELFHETASLLKQCCFDVPVIAGGPYATSDYHTILKDRAIDLVVLGEGEHTLIELISRMLKNDFKIPGSEVLKEIAGIAFLESTTAANVSRQVILYDRISQGLAREKASNLPDTEGGDSLAYVMYTSGSTGKPKGVMVDHSQVNNCIFWMQKKFNLTGCEGVVQRTNLTFDPSVWEIFWPLYTGGHLKVLSADQARDAEFLINLMIHPGAIKIMYCPASLLNAITYLLNTKSPKSRLKLPRLIIGAEPIGMDTIKNFYSYFDGEIVNTYGPTEGTINNTYYDLKRDDRRSIVPIGKPIMANNRIYILSEDLQLKPLKTDGEICISGDSVARGYINNPAKTAENFINNPFGKARLYKTGDIGRWLEDGNIEIKGRSDEQVKVRGYRIELGEIETALLTHPSISECAVVVRDNKNTSAVVRTCKMCGIRSNYPGAVINNEGFCEICRDLSKYKKYIDAYFKTPNHLVQTIEEKNKQKKGKYDCLLLYSGGRGAAYALYRLVEMGFNVLALTYDNGYFSKANLENIRKITSNLKVDHVALTHKNSDQILRESILAAHTVCRGCFHTSFALAGEYAYKNNINVVIGSTLSRGQIIENKLFMFLMQGITRIDELEEEILNIQKNAPSIDKHIFDYIDIKVLNDNTLYEKVKFIDFYRYCDITNEKMIAYLDNKDPYWKTRKNYAIYSTNCPIKQIGDFCHLKETGYHYYGSATSWEKRLGHITLNNLKEDLQSNVSPKGYENFLKRIKYKSKKTSEIYSNYLCAYFTSPGEVTPAELRKALSSLLPAYTIPSIFVPLKKFPLTSNGKIDKKALPEPTLSYGENHVAPSDEVEEKLAEILQEVLGLPKNKISMDADFFELGLHSLKSIMITSRIHKELNVKIPLAEIFKTPFIRGLSQYIKNTDQYKFSFIEQVEKREYYVLSSAQKRLYYLYQLDPGSTGNNMPTMVSLEGTLEKKRLEETFAKLIRRHESLRTLFKLIKENPYQKIVDRVSFGIEFHHPGKDLEKQRGNPHPAAGIIERFVRPFDLSQPPLMRVGLVKLAEMKHILIFDMHHIISDGVSRATLIKEFMFFYEGKELPPLKVRYKDYSEWQNLEIGKGRIEKQKEYWLKEFADEIPVLDIPYDYSRSITQSFEGNFISFTISPENTKALNALALERKTTLYMVLLSVYYLLLFKISGQEDIVIGAPTAGRIHADLQPVIGMFLNMLALRNFPREEKTFNRFLQEVKTKVLNAFDNQEYPFEDLVDKLKIRRDTGRNPLFDVIFLLQNQGAPEVEITGLKLKVLEYEFKTTKFDLSLYGEEVGPELIFNVNYSTKLFNRETVELFVQYFKRVLFSVLEDPGRKLSEIEVISKKKRAALLSQWNKPLKKEAADLVASRILQAKLNNSLYKFNDNTAVEYGEQSMSCAELNGRSNLIANWLVGEGIKKGTFIGILIENRLELIIVMLGILKAACVFVPLDSAHPNSRLEIMIKYTAISIIIGDEVNFHRLADFIRKQSTRFIFTADLFAEDKPARFRESPAVHYSTEDNIYIYFTSGTGGNPKAIMGKNESLLHFINWEINRFEIKENVRISQFTNPGFDAFLRDIFVPVCSGGVICIPRTPEILLTPDELVKWIERSGINLIHCVPSLFRSMNSNSDNLTENNFKELKFILLSGERIAPSDLVHWMALFGKRIKVVNLWGTSETTLAKTCYFIKESDVNKELIPVGKPITGASVFVLDKHNNICPELITGQLYIATPFRTVGYNNSPRLNKERFIPNPFNKNSGEVLHQTGDLGRWLPGGSLDVLGRNDRQVKIRGIRIELEEIESVLVKHPLVKEAVVIKKEMGSNNDSLYAYVTGIEHSKRDENIFTFYLKEYLSGKLPGYMLPASIIKVERIPRNPNGKVDYKKLADALENETAGYIPPGNNIEMRLLILWSEILGIEKRKISVIKIFFEMGGNSLNILSLISKIHKEFNVKISPKEIFKAPTIKGLAEIIMGAKEDKYASIAAVEEKEYYDLSPAQMRLYVTQQMNPESIAYNMSYAFEVEGEIKRGKLDAAFKKLIKRHACFKTAFRMIGNKVVQVISANVAFNIEYYDFKAGHREITNTEMLVRDFVKPFDLGKAPLLRIGIIKTAENRDIMIVDMHHIISDGISLSILIEEFTVLYGGAALPELRIRFKDYSEWQNSSESKERIKKQEKYWLNRFKSDIPVISLPTDYTRPVKQDYEGDIVTFAINKELTSRLKEQALKEDVSGFTMLSAIFNILLARVTGEQDIVVGTGIEGRMHEDLKKIIGMFVNTLALRNFPTPNKTFREFLKELKENTLEAFENQDYPFEDIVETLGIKRNISRNPLFDVMFQFNNYKMPALNISGLILNRYGYNRRTAKFDLTLWCNEGAEEFFFAFEYRTNLFKKETINIFIRYFLEIVSSVTVNPGEKICEINLISPVIKQELLEQLNSGIEMEARRMRECGQILQHRLNASLKKFENKIAIEFGNINLSCGELDKRSYYVAKGIIHKRIQKETPIGALMDDRMMLICTAIGILKAGCVFVPLEPTSPQTRLKMMMETTDINFLFIDQSNRSPLTTNDIFKPQNRDVELISIEEWFANGEPIPSVKLPDIRYLPEDKIYIYFTSGSTGIPKPIVGKNSSLLHFINWEISTLAVDNAFIVSQLTNPGFDAFLRDVFVPLCAGGRICIPFEQHIKINSQQLINWVERSQVNLIHCVPVLFRLLKPDHLTPENFKALKYVLFSGERINAHDLTDWFDVFNERITFVNLYGPTETTLIKTFHFIERNDLKKERIPVGKPIRGAGVMILDKNMNLCDKLVTGEIYIRTPYRTYGYYNDPVLNSKKFLQDPFSRAPGDMIHKTGDMGKVLADGNIDFIGRNDRQIKVRGIRIEPEEIENVLLGHPLVKEAAVIKRKQSGANERLWAYISGKEKHILLGKDLIDTIKEFLAQKLPNYMVPTNFTKVENIPRKPNGKIDWEALEALDVEGTGYIPPGSDVERKLVELWSDILKVDKIGIMNSFFELGGNSLNVMTLITHIHRVFDVRIPLGVVFKNNSIEMQAKIILGAKKDKYESIAAVEEKEYYDLSPVQMRLYITQQMNPENIAYNMSNVFEFEGETNREKLNATFKKIIKRQACFRTSFRMIGSIIVQVISANLAFNIEYYDFEAGHREITYVETLIRDFIKPFDLDKAPLLRIGIIKAAEKRHIMVIDMHHIISDGISLSILIEEFMTLYEGGALQELRIQYKDYSEWQNSEEKRKARERQEDYWLRELEGEIPVLNLPHDFPRPAELSFEGRRLAFFVEKEDIQRLKALASKEEVTLFILLLSIYNVLLAKVSGQESIVVGIPVAKREHEDLQPIIGAFASNLVSRNYPEGKKTFKQFLGEIRERTLEAFANQDYPFTNLVERLAVKRDPSRNPIFDTQFQYWNIDVPEVKITGLKIKGYNYWRTTAKIDLTLAATEVGDDLHLGFNYNSNLFKEETIEKFSLYFKNIISSVLDDPGKRLSEIEMVSTGKREEIFSQYSSDLEEEWNE